MKLTKKKLFTMAIAVCMIAILSFSSLAWFTDDDAVKNEFFMATDSETEDDIFSVDILENLDVDGDGTKETVASGSDTANDKIYENILPGSVLVKEPYAKNTGSYDQYIRVKVVVKSVTDWAEMLTPYNLTVEDLWKDSLDGNWERLYGPEGDPNNDTITYTYYYKEVVKCERTSVDPDQKDTLTTPVFTEVVIPNQLTRGDMAKMTDGTFSIDVTAEAVQTENLGDGVDTPYEAFKLIMPTVTPDIVNP